MIAMLSIEDIAVDVIQESILNWYEEDENFTEQQAEQVYSAVYHKLKYGGWKAAKEELESHNLDGIASYIEASFDYAYDDKKERHIEEAKQSKEEALQADADSVKQMELF